MRIGLFYEHQLPKPWGPDAEHRLLKDALDQIELAADLVRLHRLSTFPPRVGRQVDTILRMSELTVEAMPRLRSPESLADFWIEINRLENEADSLNRISIGALFDTEKDPSPS